MSKHLSGLKIPLHHFQRETCKQQQKLTMNITRWRWSGRLGPACGFQFTGRCGNWRPRTMWTTSLEVWAWAWAWRVGLETLSAELLRIEGVAQGFAVSQWLSQETKISFSHLPRSPCGEAKGLNCYKYPACEGPSGALSLTCSPRPLSAVPQNVDIFVYGYLNDYSNSDHQIYWSEL